MPLEHNQNRELLSHISRDLSSDVQPTMARIQWALVDVIRTELSEKFTYGNAKTAYVTPLLPTPSLLRLHMVDIFTRGPLLENG